MKAKMSRQFHLTSDAVADSVDELKRFAVHLWTKWKKNEKKIISKVENLKIDSIGKYLKNVGFGLWGNQYTCGRDLEASQNCSSILKNSSKLFSVKDFKTVST